MKTAYFSTRDYVFAAATACAFLLVSSVIIPFTLPLRIPGLANAAVAPFSSFFLVIALLRIGKPGALLLITGLYALLCLAISPVIFGFVLTGGLTAELVCTAVFRGYRRVAAAVVGAVVYAMAMFPAALYFSFLLTPARFHRPALWVGAAAETAIGLAALAGGLAGARVARELSRAGKLRLEIIG